MLLAVPSSYRKKEEKRWIPDENFYCGELGLTKLKEFKEMLLKIVRAPSLIKANVALYNKEEKKREYLRCKGGNWFAIKEKQNII